MAFINYKSTNNAQGTLLAGISASATAAILATGEGAKFPSTFPFFVKAEKYDTALNNYRVLKREIWKVTGRTTDTLTIVRSSGTCPPDYATNTPGTTAFSFDVGDTISHVITAEQEKDNQDEIARLETAKLNLSGGTMTGLLSQKKGVDIASATTTDLSLIGGNYGGITGTTTITSFGANCPAGTQITVDFLGILTLTHNATSLILPAGGANITTAVGDTAIFISEGSGNWDCVSYIRANGYSINSPVSEQDFIFGDGSDGALTVTSGTTNINLNQVYNFSSITISAGASLSSTGTGSPMFLKCNGLTTIDGTINLSGKVGVNLSSYIFGKSTANIGTAGTGGNGGKGGTYNGGTAGGNGGTGTNGYGGGGGGGGCADTVHIAGTGGNGGTPGGIGGTSANGGTGGNAYSNNGGNGGTGGGNVSGRNGGLSAGGGGASTTTGGGINGAGGGAGGTAGLSGGSIVLYSKSFSGAGTINLSGLNAGIGGAGGTNQKGGGGGGGGGGGAGGSGIIIGKDNNFGGTINVTKGIGGALGAAGGSMFSADGGAAPVAGGAGTDGTNGNSVNSKISAFIF